ncbi:MAG TPA: MarR family transcriptional regulator [Thermoleophilaceae bacterium]|jgi:DNA-binding MarR family transcriptional regulator
MAVDPVTEKALRAHPCFLLAHLGRVAKRRYADALEPTGLKGPEAFALMRLRELGPISQQELADTLDLDPSKLVALLNELESDGLAERRRDPCDRRRHIVEISPRGHERLADADRVMANFEVEFFSGLAPDELHELQRLLARVAQRVACDEIGSPLEDTRPESDAAEGVAT